MPAAPRRRPAPRSPRGDIRRRGSLVRSRSVTSRPYRPGSSSPIGLIRADRPRPHPKSPRTDMRRRPDMPRKPRDVSLTALLEESRNSNGSDVARFRRLGARTVTTRPEFAGCDNLIQISIHRSANWTRGQARSLRRLHSPRSADKGIACSTGGYRRAVLMRRIVTTRRLDRDSARDRSAPAAWAEGSDEPRNTGSSPEMPAGTAPEAARVRPAGCKA